MIGSTHHPRRNPPNMTDPTRDREALGDVPNPLGLAGIEFIEYATTRPQALGQVLEMMGFKPIASHR